MFRKAWNTSQMVMPAASSMPKRSGAPRAARTPKKAMSTKARITAEAPSRPTSSATMAKMKSEWASGRKPHLARLAPNPTPPIPPEAIPTRLWMIWKPVRSGSCQGSRKLVSRSWR